MTDKHSRRLDRQFEKLGRTVPASVGFLTWVRQPSSRLLRIPLGLLLILGGIFSFLPVLGIWMLPLGLLLLALDMPFLQPPLNRAILWTQRKWAAWKRRGKSKT